MQVYSTNKVDPQRRLEYWSALNSNAMVPMRVSADRDAAFEGRLWVDQLGGIGVSRAYSSGVVIRRGPTDAPRTGERAFVLTMSEGASYTVRGRDSERIVRGGDLRLSDSTETMEITHSGCSVIVLRFREPVLRAYLPAADDLVGMVVSGERGAGYHASTMIRSVARTMHHGLGDGVSEHLSAALLHSVAAAFVETYGARSASPVTADSRRFEVRRFVEANLSDSELTVQKVAAAFGLSDRYLRMLFEASGDSLSTYIQRRRLEESARQLRDPLCRARTVSDIAFAWGFNSLGSYDRAFKARFAMAPRKYRQGHTES